jgi:anthraniloyl-CoA monooxygenase
VDRFAETAGEVVSAGLAAYAGQPPDDPDRSLSDWVVAQPFATAAGWSCPTRLLQDAEDVDLVDAPMSGEPTRDRLRLVRVEVDLDDPWTPAADSLVAGARKALDADCDGVLLTGGDDLDAVLTLLETAERVRAETGGVVAVRAAARWRDHLVSGLASGRADLLDVVPDEAVR